MGLELLLRAHLRGAGKATGPSFAVSAFGFLLSRFMAANGKLMEMCDLSSLGCLYFVNRNARRHASKEIRRRLRDRVGLPEESKIQWSRRSSEFDFPYGSCAEGIELLFPALRMKPTPRFGQRIIDGLLAFHGEISTAALHHLVTRCGLNSENAPRLPITLFWDSRNAEPIQRVEQVGVLMFDYNWPRSRNGVGELWQTLVKTTPGMEDP